MAWNLKAGAELLFHAQFNSHAEDGEPINPEHEHLDGAATMLYGRAVENMIKGYLILNSGDFKTAMDAHPKAWRGHKIADLAAATNIPLNKDQKLLLRTLESFIVWGGRYPICFQREDYTIPTQFGVGTHMTPCEINRVGIETLEPFYKQMDEEIRKSRRKDGLPLDFMEES